MDKNKKKEIVKMLLKNKEEIDEEELMELLFDKPIAVDVDKLDQNKIVYISALNNEGIDKLKDKIKEIFNFEQIETDDLTYLTNARSLSLLRQSLKLINDIKNGVEKDLPIDILEIDLKKVWELLGNIIGETYEEELINQLFSQFCLGK